VNAVFNVPSAGGIPGGGIKTQESYLAHLILAGWAGTSAASIGLGGAGLAAGAGLVGVWANAAVALAAINRTKNLYFIAW
jgi:hypothetical protein